MSQDPDAFAQDLAIGLAVHMKDRETKALGLTNRLTRDADMRFLAERLAEHLRRSGWVLEHQAVLRVPGEP